MTRKPTAGLAGVLGHTRAAVLRSLRDPGGTADLATWLGIIAMTSLRGRSGRPTYPGSSESGRPVGVPGLG